MCWTAFIATWNPNVYDERQYDERRIGGESRRPDGPLRSCSEQRAEKPAQCVMALLVESGSMFRATRQS